MSGHIKIYVGSSGERRLAGEIPPFDIQPPVSKGVNFCGVAAQFERMYGQVVAVIVATQAEADVLLQLQGARSVA